jgi:hypothetical protein
VQKTTQPSSSNATITTPIIQLARKSVIISPHQHKNTIQVQQLFNRIYRLVSRTEAIMSRMDDIEKKRSMAAAKTITIKV